MNTGFFRLSPGLLLAIALTAPGGTAQAGEISLTDSGVQQLRIYEIPEANQQVFHTRFRDDAARIMKKYGFRIKAIWESRFDGKLEFIYLLDWPDEATMKAAWAAFMVDEEWKAIKKRTGAEHGRFVNSIEDRTLHPVPYSPALDAMPD
ncbi:MAG: NIPSNAP family containing protein [Alphaproteobacteria bacterium]|nr:MAG: NIPSNAP family containing protein [Alphaproteobacteria bacterium]